MLELTLILCVVSVTWAVSAPTVMPRVTHYAAPMHRMNFSSAAQVIVMTGLKDYAAHAPKPNATWTVEEWKESLEQCQKRFREARTNIISKLPSEDVAGVEHFLESLIHEAETNQYFQAFLTESKRIAEQFGLSQKDSIIKIFQETLQPGCLGEMPATILKESWKKCVETVMSGAPPEEKAKTDGYLRRVALRELPSLSRDWREQGSAKSTVYTELCLADARKMLRPQDYEAVKDMIEEYLTADENMNKTGFTPKQWSDYQRSREVQFFQMIEKAAENNPAHANQVRAAFELIKVRHERLKIRDKMLFLRRVVDLTTRAHLSFNTTKLLIWELKKIFTITHTHIGFGDEDERRANREMAMSFGVIKMRLLDSIPIEEHIGLTHLFIKLSRDLPDPQQDVIRIVREEDDREPFENYTTSIARKCKMCNKLLYTFLETHRINLPGPAVIEQLNRVDYFRRRVILIGKWGVVELLVILDADELQANSLDCFFRTIRKDFLNARRKALYRHVQTDGMSFVDHFRSNIRSHAKRVNISSENVDSMLQIVSALRPNVSLPENEDPTLKQLMLAYLACSKFTTSFKEQCYATIKDHEGLDKFFRSLEASLNRERLTPHNLEDNGFICDTPEGSEHKIRDTSNPDPRVLVVHPRPANLPLRHPPGNVHPHQEPANHVPGTPS